MAGFTATGRHVPAVHRVCRLSICGTALATARPICGLYLTLLRVEVAVLRVRRLAVRTAAVWVGCVAACIRLSIAAGATSPDISPNTSGVPGIGSFRQIAGGLATAALIACGVGLIVSAVVWAVASNSNNFHHAQKGKTGVLYACMAALLIGGVNLIIAFWNNIGTALH